MPSDRLLRILIQLRADRGVAGEPEQLCAVSAGIADADGASIVLASGNAPSSLVCSSNSVSAKVEELQFSLGEGPSVDAVRGFVPVLEPDLVDPFEGRWPAFSPPAISAGVRSIFAFPLLVETGCLGALCLYRHRPVPLNDEQHSDVLTMAGVAARWMLMLQADNDDFELTNRPEGADLRLVVHQATGMVSVQIGVSISDALARLRAYAFAVDRPVTDVARDVVARRFRFDEHYDD